MGPTGDEGSPARQQQQQRLYPDLPPQEEARAAGEELAADPRDAEKVPLEGEQPPAAAALSDPPDSSAPPPEGGWGWLVMLAAMWCNGAVFGIQNACGVLFISLLKEFGSAEDKQLRFKTETANCVSSLILVPPAPSQTGSAALTTTRGKGKHGFKSNVSAWVNSLSMGMIFFCSPIVSVFTDVFGCRKTAVVGAAVGIIGLLSSSFVSSIEPLYFTYGIVFACGCSFAYQPSLVILGHYFKKRLGLVNGIVTAGSSLFTVVMPFLLRVLLDSVGLFNTLRILCTLMFVLFLAGFSYIPLVPGRQDLNFRMNGKFRMPPVSTIFNFSIFKITSYKVWVFGIPVALFGYFVPYVHLMSHVKERIGPDVNTEVLLLCLGITSGVGRMGFGQIADYIPGVKKVYLQVTSFFFIGLMSMMIPLCNTFGSLIAVCLLMGLFDGCFICIMAPIAFELVGPRNVSPAIGFLLGFMSVPMMVGPPVAGYLRDHLGSYDVAFYLAGVPPMIGGVVLCLIPWVHQRDLQRKSKTMAINGDTEEKMLDNNPSVPTKLKESESHV